MSVEPMQDTPLFSTDGAVQLIMQSDGNVVLYNSTKVQQAVLSRVRTPMNVATASA